MWFDGVKPPRVNRKGVYCGQNNCKAFIGAGTLWKHFEKVHPEILKEAEAKGAK